MVAALGAAEVAAAADAGAEPVADEGRSSEGCHGGAAAERPRCREMGHG
jgi:hypothetical protein